MARPRLHRPARPADPSPDAGRGACFPRAGPPGDRLAPRLPGRAWHRLPQHPILPARGVDHDHHPAWTLISHGTTQPGPATRPGAPPRRPSQGKQSGLAAGKRRTSPGQAASRPVAGQRRRTAYGRCTPPCPRRAVGHTRNRGDRRRRRRLACMLRLAPPFLVHLVPIVPQRKPAAFTAKTLLGPMCPYGQPEAAGGRCLLPVLARIQARPSARSRRRYHRHGGDDIGPCLGECLA